MPSPLTSVDESLLETNPRWFISQEGSRQSYAVPLAFHQLGVLRQFYVDTWCRWGRSLFQSGPKGGRALATHFHPGLPSRSVVSFNTSVLYSRAKFHFERPRMTPVEIAGEYCRFGEKFAKLVRDHIKRQELDPRRDAFFGFNTNCLETIEYLREQKILTVVDQVDPAKIEEDLVMEETERWPGWAKNPGRMPQWYWDRLSAEWETADIVLVNSRWSADALIKQGVPKEKIVIAPLAVDFKRSHAENPVNARGTLKVLWLGSIILRKGIQYFIEAARLLQKRDMEFLIAGSMGISNEALRSFPANVKLLGGFTRDQLPDIYRQSHIFVLPTLSDGFAVTQLEAMAQALPVIATPNCGRVVTDGSDGFIVPARDGQALAEALVRLDNDRALLRHMSENALRTAQRHDIPSNGLAILEQVKRHRRKSRELFNGGNALRIEINGASPSPLPTTHSMNTVNTPTRVNGAVNGKKNGATPRAVICFSGARDDYQAAWALSEAGLLEKLVTDIYSDPDHMPLARMLGKKFPKILVRHSPGVSSERVVTPLPVAVRSLLMKTGFASEGRQIQLDRALGRRARVEAWKSKAALFSYSYYAAEAFAPGAMRPELRFLFQLHPHPKTVRTLLREELERHPQFAASLRWEHEIGAPESHFLALCGEPALANGWVTASSFTAKTLAENGCPRDQIHVVPYGVNARKFPCRQAPPRTGDPFRIIWVGNMTQRKGLSYFLEAIASVPQKDLEVLVCGHHAVERKIIESYGISSIRVLRGLPTSELTQLMREADLFVLPSLAEGFGHVILEAMSSGLPVLTTPSTCAPDVLTDGEHGFIVPIRNSEALAAKISWGRVNRLALYRMGLAAGAQARLFTWERFRRNLIAAFNQMVEGRLAVPEISPAPARFPLTGAPVGQ